MKIEEIIEKIEQSRCLFLKSPTMEETITIFKRLNMSQILVKTISLNSVSFDILEASMPDLNAFLGKQKELEKLELSNCFLGRTNKEMFIEFVVSLSTCKNLKMLALNNLEIRAEYFRILSPAFMSFSALIYLFLGENAITHDSLSLLLSSLKSDNIEALSLSGNLLEEKHIDVVGKFLKLKQKLKFFYLSSCGLKNASLEKLLTFFKANPNIALVEFFLDGNNFTDNSVEHLIEVVRLQPELCSFRITEGAFSLTGIQALKYGFFEQDIVLANTLRNDLKSQIIALLRREIDSVQNSLTKKIEILDMILSLEPHDVNTKCEKSDMLSILTEEMEEAYSTFFDEKRRQRNYCKTIYQIIEKPLTTACRRLQEFYETEDNFLKKMQAVQMEILSLVDPILISKLRIILADISNFSWVWGRLKIFSPEAMIEQLIHLIQILTSPAFIRHYAVLTHYILHYAHMTTSLNHFLVEISTLRSDKRELYRLLLLQWTQGEGTLMMPVQRLPRYELLLKDLQKDICHMASGEQREHAKKLLDHAVTQIEGYARLQKEGFITVQHSLEEIMASLTIVILEHPRELTVSVQKKAINFSLDFFQVIKPQAEETVPDNNPEVVNFL